MVVEQLAEIARPHLRPGRQAQLEFLQELEQVGVLRLRRLVVVAVRRRHVRLQQELRRLDIGRDHAFLDQLVRVVTLQHAGLRDLALRSEHEAHFR